MKHIERKKLIQQQLTALPAANKPKEKDGSALFKLVGGKYHDVVVRSYAPWEDIVFPNGDRYEYRPEPITTRSKQHYYGWVRNDNDHNGLR